MFVYFSCVLDLGILSEKCQSCFRQVPSLNQFLLSPGNSDLRFHPQFAQITFLSPAQTRPLKRPYEGGGGGGGKGYGHRDTHRDLHYSSTYDPEYNRDECMSQTLTCVPSEDCVAKTPGKWRICLFVGLGEKVWLPYTQIYVYRLFYCLFMFEKAFWVLFKSTKWEIWSCSEMWLS